MDIESIRTFCLEKQGVTEETPFGPDNLVFKVGGKIFCIMDLVDQPLRLALKSDPNRIPELREEFEGIGTGPYLNAKHWISVQVEMVPINLLVELIDLSYLLVYNGLTKKVKEQIA